jgi:cytochrome c oxidase subunit 2
MFIGKNRSIRKAGIGASLGALVALLTASPAMAQIKDFQLGFQESASPVMDMIASFHIELVWIITATCLFVLGLLIWVVLKYRASVNPVPSKVSHNAILEVAWTVIPVIILVVIAIPSFKLLYFQHDIPKADVTIRAIGKQWFWTYEYPGSQANFSFDATMLTEEAAKAAGKPRLLGTDNPVVVPVNKNIVIETAGADVIHSWAIPQFGVKMDAVPGRINHTWFRATKTGVFYGQCSELCGANHAFMPIEVHVVSDAEYAAWLAQAKGKFSALAANNNGALRVASK